MQARPGGGLGLRLNAATLLRAAAVVRDWRHIGNRCDANAQRTQSTNRRLATWTWALDLDVEVFDALFLLASPGSRISDAVAA